MKSNQINILWLVVAIILIGWWLSLASNRSDANDTYWSTHIEECSKIGGFMEADGQCHLDNQ